jgi:superfamily II DNA/RNA helicase
MLQDLGQFAKVEALAVLGGTYMRAVLQKLKGNRNHIILSTPGRMYDSCLVFICFIDVF